MDLRLLFAILTGKTLSFVLKLFGSGSTAAPGLFALNIDPNFVKKLSGKIARGAIIITGTNGKTTTSRLAYDILSTKYKVIHNRQGSNLLRGIASTLVKHSSIFGHLDFELAIWEVDEAVFGQATANTNAKVVVLLNLFRDQLDRYGEIDTIRQNWQKALSKLPTDTKLILNVDDALINFLRNSYAGEIIDFGIEARVDDLPKIANISDVKLCPNCQSKLIFETVISAHAGHYKCSKCTFMRNKPTVFTKNLKLEKGFQSTFNLHASRIYKVNSKLPGVYNVYNILAAASIAKSQDINDSVTVNTIQNYSSAFGRFQKVKVAGKNIIIFLIKNPAGANEVIRTLTLETKINLLAVLNDNFADGKDVSWIWDTNWEAITKNINSVATSGLRSTDLANRFKYAGIKMSKNSIYKEISYSIRKSLAILNNNDTLLVLSTYTALLEVQKTLSKITNSPKWHSD